MWLSRAGTVRTSGSSGSYQSRSGFAVRASALSKQQIAKVCAGKCSA
ncbi:hypothetical protein [Streptomyces sp. SA3_actF]|nr:hypothetical protein [Streptomyces sp. SA3_actF]